MIDDEYYIESLWQDLTDEAGVVADARGICSAVLAGDLRVRRTGLQRHLDLWTADARRWTGAVHAHLFPWKRPRHAAPDGRLPGYGPSVAHDTVAVGALLPNTGGACRVECQRGQCPYRRAVADEDFTPWTPEGAARLRAAAVELTAAITAHAEAVTAVKKDTDITEVFAAGDRLLPAALAYADAQFDYTGNGFPFGVLHQFAEQDDDDEPADEPEPAAGISVLQRHDYRVTDEAAVMSAGRRAYLDAWPEDDEAAAAADVTHLGRALYQIAHASGWHNLDEVEGLRATGGVVVVVAQSWWPKRRFSDRIRTSGRRTSSRARASSSTSRRTSSPVRSSTRQPPGASPAARGTDARRARSFDRALRGGTGVHLRVLSERWIRETNPGFRGEPRGGVLAK